MRMRPIPVGRGPLQLASLPAVSRAPQCARMAKALLDSEVVSREHADARSIGMINDVKYDLLGTMSPGAPYSDWVVVVNKCSPIGCTTPELQWRPEPKGP